MKSLNGIKKPITTAVAQAPPQLLRTGSKTLFPTQTKEISPFQNEAQYAVGTALGHNFGNVALTAPLAAEPSPWSRLEVGTCPLAAPRACPFGGACHSCPVSVQAKLAISQPGDIYEQEADRAAEQVMGMSDGEVLQRRCSTCDMDEDEVLRPKELPGRTPTAAFQADVPPIVQEVLRSPGQPLDPATRAFLEPRFGHDFSQVKLHTDTKSGESAEAVGALAYTMGSHITFGVGQYDPSTSKGQELLAHELAHVLQQTLFNQPYHDIKGLHFEEDFEVEKQGTVAECNGAMSGSINYPLGLQRKVKGGGPGLCGGTWTCAASPCDLPDPGREGRGGPASAWTIKIMIDTEAPAAEDVTYSTVGHTYVEFSDSSGASFTYGFYPDKTAGTPDPIFHPSVAGCMVHPDISHKACVDYEETFNPSQQKYTEALSFAQSLCKTPPAYNLLTFNCTTFASEVSQKAGHRLPAIRGKVGSGTLSAIADNPYTLLEGLKRRDIGPTYNLTSDSDLREAITNASAADLSRSPVAEKIRVINRLLDGWISEGDIAAIEKICKSVSTSVEMDQIRKSVGKREAAIFNDEQKRRFHAAINLSP